MKERVIIFGIGQFADVAYDCLKNDSEFEIACFTVDKSFCDKDSFKGLPVIAFEEIEKKYPPSEFSMFLPISYNNLNKFRKKKYEEAKAKGYKVISYVSSKAINNAKKIGENCFILELNNIQTGVEIGDNVVLWSGNHIGHHTIIRDNCFIASHAVISGSVEIGENCFVGVNTTIRDNIKIGKESIIGAAAIVLKNAPDYSVISQKSTEISKITSDKIKKI